MKTGGVGGAHTARAGSDYEKLTHDLLISDLQKIGYEIKEIKPGNNSPRGISMAGPRSTTIEFYFKAAIHKDFFEPRGVRSADYFSARLEPDTAIYSESTKTLTIIEKKQQTTPGSVAEKLQTCDFKMLYYTTLCKPLGIKVDLIWQLGEYFKRQEKQLESIFKYMESKGSSYYFHKVPVDKLKI